MQNYRLALIGFGNVGQGLAQILVEKGDWLQDTYGAAFSIVAVCDMQKGSLYDPSGLDPAVLLQSVTEKGSLKQIDAPYKNWDALKTIKESSADCVVEISYTDLATGEPATSHIKAALTNKKHAVTTNKGPVALHFDELRQMALSNGVELGVEGTVMSGTPALTLGSDTLKAAGLTKIEGILNGTTNYILTKMAAGSAFSAVLEEAQELGYAEADPTGDVEGFDAAGKVVILANLLMDAGINMADVDRQGITSLTLADIQNAKDNNAVWKLIGKVEKNSNGVTASVKPTQIGLDHPLAGVSGATNAITYTSDLMGKVTLIGAGAGRMETGFALLSDLLAIHRKVSRQI